MSSGTLAVDITADGMNDLISINSGSANLDGKLEININAGSYVEGTTYEIINGPTNGTEFSRITQIIMFIRMPISSGSEQR